MPVDSCQVPSAAFRIREAIPADVPQILGFVRELAEFEKLSHLVTATEAGMHEALFGTRPAAEALLAFDGETPVGFALFFHSFSTFLGARGLWLEDLYVSPAHRRRGFGRAMLLHVARIAHQRGCGRFEWSALDWNEPAIRFYKSLGAALMDDWTTFRVTGSALEHLANLRD
jgi:GNAT superfamily N-acetyltransferase